MSTAPAISKQSDYFKERRELINSRLQQLVPSVETRPQILHQAMHYSLFAGGKRVRPLLVLASGESLGAEINHLLPISCAFEMVHTYSLIHDDLPSMDNDDLRRGMPTCHKKFGEAIALLAGDALLTLAFQVVAEMKVPNLLMNNKIAVIAELARSSGTVGGMIGGQVADLESAGKPVDSITLNYVHGAKTGALISAAVVSGGIMADASDSELDILRKYGKCIGLAFQIADDVLDITSPAHILGKTPGKDVMLEKATFPALYGVEGSQKRARELVEEAINAIDTLGPNMSTLISLAYLVIERVS